MEMERDGEKEKAEVKGNGKMDCLEATNFQEGVSIKIQCHGIFVIKLMLFKNYIFQCG